MAPAGTPAAIIDKINKDVVEGLQDAAMQDRMAKQGGVVVMTIVAQAVRRDHQERHRALHQDVRGRGARREIAPPQRHDIGNEPGRLAVRLFAFRLTVWNCPKSLRLRASFVLGY